MQKKAFFLTSLLTAAGLLAGADAASAQQWYHTFSPNIIAAPAVKKQAEGSTVRIITSEEIQRSPAQNVPDLLREIGINVHDLFGDIAAARTAVDLRGFGASAGQNTVILVNGRRLNAMDASPVNFASIPLAWVERIEIVKGPVSGVLYGEGAVGGAVNIITKAPPKQTEIGGKITYGSDQTLMANAQAGTSFGRIRAAHVQTDGYRDNNEIKQTTLGLDLNHEFGKSLRVYMTADAYKQDVGLPGALSDAAAQADRKQASTPDDKGTEKAGNVSMGAVYHFSDQMRLYLPVNVSLRNIESEFYATAGDTHVETDLKSYVFSPKLQGNSGALDYTAGLYGALQTYESDRKDEKNKAPYHRFEGDQTQIDAYGQGTFSLSKELKISAGARVLYTDLSMENTYDAANDASGTSGPQYQDADEKEVNYAGSVGADYKIIPNLSVFGNVARNIRLPNADERILASGRDFKLKTQEALNYEAGLSYTRGTALTASVSGYYMRLNNELHYNPYQGNAVVNLDQTQRLGLDAALSIQPWDFLGFKANYLYTKAEFRKGDLKGKDVPLVPEHTVGGSVFAKYEFVDAALSVKYVGKAYMDDDQYNRKQKMDGYVTVDAKIGAAYGPARIELIARNLLDEEYYTYAAASTNPAATDYTLYPMPGRTFLISLGAKF